MPLLCRILTFWFCLAAGAASAVTIYSEDFSNQEGKGLRGSHSTQDTIVEEDFDGVTWRVSAGNAQLFDSDDSISVVGGRLTFRDVNSQCIGTHCRFPGTRPSLNLVGLPTFQTPTIDVSGYTNLKLIFDVGFKKSIYEPTGGAGDQDYLEVFALLNGQIVKTTGNLVIVSNPSNQSVVFDQLGEGTTLQLVARAANDTQAEDFRLDNILLTGAVPFAPVPLPASAFLLLGAMLTLSALRYVTHKDPVQVTIK